jgi:L-asparaginase II
VATSVGFVERARIWRGPVLKRVYHIIIAGAGGGLRDGWGDPISATAARSSLKPFQAAALMEFDLR